MCYGSDRKEDTRHGTAAATTQAIGSETEARTAAAPEAQAELNRTSHSAGMRSAMPLPAAYWACLALLILTGMLCRSWPALSLYGATAAFCAVGQALLRFMPSDPLIVFADSVLFVLPTVVLVRACGVSEESAIFIGLIVPLALGVDERIGADIRSTLLVIGVGTVQGFAALRAIRNEARSEARTTSRWVAVCIAAIGVLGLAFCASWIDVAWTSVAAHAFACIVYLADEQRQ